MKRLIDFCKGKFGKYRLVTPYRQIWIFLILTIFAVGLFKGMFLFFTWWDRVIMGLNHLIR